MEVELSTGTLCEIKLSNSVIICITVSNHMRVFPDLSIWKHQHVHMQFLVGFWEWNVELLLLFSQKGSVSYYILVFLCRMVIRIQKAVILSLMLVGVKLYFFHWGQSIDCRCYLSIVCSYIIGNFINFRSDLVLCQWLWWVGHVVMMGKTEAYRILERKPFGNSTWQVRRWLKDSINLHCQ